MDDKSNFFNAIGQWSNASLQLQFWMRTHFMDTVFALMKAKVITSPDLNDPTKTISVTRVLQVDSQKDLEGDHVGYCL